MYSIILLRVTNIVSFKRYQFVFQSAKVKEELEICYWDTVKETSDNNGVDVVIRELNARLRKHFEWKLVIYDEKCENAVPDEIMKGFIKLLTGTGASDRYNSEVEITFPTQILYVYSKEKTYIPFGAKSAFCQIDRERQLGGNLRMLLFEMETGNSRLRSYSELKLCCILVSLALGEIPYIFIEAGYLYDIDIEIEQKQFIRYIMILERKLEQIKEGCDRERENVKRQLRIVAQFPEIHIPEMSLENSYIDQRALKEKQRILTFREMLDNTDVDWVLKQNRELLERQMFYPKGVLHEESKKIRKNIEELKGVGNFLDEAGKELLNRKVIDIFNEMCEKKDKQLKQQEFEKDIVRTEELIKNQSMRIMKKKERQKVLLLGAFGESIVLAAYVANLVYTYGFKEKICFLLGAVLLAFVIVYGGYYLYLFLCYIVESWGGWKRLVNRLWDYQKEKKQYLESMLNLILRYQYLEKICEEQERLKQQCNNEFEMLENHERMLDNGITALRPLICLIDQSEREENIAAETLKIDFTKEPKEEDYYQIPFQKSRCQMEINYSGYKTKTEFNFITRLIIKKVICHEEEE